MKIAREEDGIMTKEPIYQEDIMVLNMYQTTEPQNT